jgi:hypothetical protein
MKHLNLQSADLELLLVNDMRIRLKRRDGQREPEKPSLHVRVAGFGLVQRVDQELGGRRTLANHRMIGKVIKVAVSQPQADDLEPAVGSLTQQSSGGVIRSVKENGLLGSLVRDEETVGHRDAAGIGES